MNKTKSPKLQEEILINKIYFIRGQKIMLDRDLAELYGVETKRLKEAVKRNIGRFPSDFMFELSQSEFENLRTQFASSSWGGNRVMSFAFTEQGVTMLSSVLNSERAVEVNIRVVRLFIRLREVIISNKEILIKLEQLENRVGNNDKQIQMIFNYLKKLLNPTIPPHKKVQGYRKEA